MSDQQTENAMQEGFSDTAIAAVELLKLVAGTDPTPPDKRDKDYWFALYTECAETIGTPKVKLVAGIDPADLV